MPFEWKPLTIDGQIDVHTLFTSLPSIIEICLTRCWWTYVMWLIISEVLDLATYTTNEWCSLLLIQVIPQVMVSHVYVVEEIMCRLTKHEPDVRDETYSNTIVCSLPVYRRFPCTISLTRLDTSRCSPTINNVCWPLIHGNDSLSWKLN